MKNKIYHLILTGFFSVMLMQCAHAQGISVAPSRMFFSGKPGQKVTQQITLTNTSKVPVIFKSSFKDWLRDTMGTKVYFEKGQLPASNANWLSIAEDVTELEPGEKKEVTVTMNIPAGTAAVTTQVSNAMLFFTQINEQKIIPDSIKGNSIGVIIKLEMAVHVYYTPPQLTRKDFDFLAFDDLGLTQKNGGDGANRRLALRIKNTGEIVGDARVHFELTDKDSGDEIKFPERTISMLPGAELVVYMDIPKKPKGTHYLAVALLDSGSEANVKVAEKQIVYVQ